MRVILVTGANKGLGLAVARAVLVAAPDTVVLLGCRDLVRGEVAVHQLETELGCQDRLLALQLDVTSQESVAAAADWTRKRFTSLAGLVNNAGATYLESARAVMEVNYFGAARVCEAFIPLLEDAGRIVNISSFGAQSHVENCSKAAQRLLSDPATPLEEVEARLLWPFLEVADHPDLDRQAKATGIARLDLVPPIPYPPIEVDGQPADWKEYVYGAYSVAKVCLNCLTLDLAKKYPRIGINACEPGVFKSDLSLSTLDKIGLKLEDFQDKLGPAATPSVVVTRLLLEDGIGSGNLFGSDGLRSPLYRTRNPGEPEYDGTLPSIF